MKLYLSLILILSLFLSCDEPNSNSTNTTLIDKLELPQFKDGFQIRYYTNYTISYNEEFELANWVAYELTKEELIGDVERTDDFRGDPLITTGTATDNDYSGSGYDRGHLMPAADCVWDETAMSESLYYSNMAPQVAGLNRGEWKQLEENFRDIAKTYDKVWIITGPILDELIEFIGVNKVAVPKYYYKAGIYLDNGVYKAIAYILPNQAIDNSISLSSFSLSIDSLENRIGYDLYYKLDDNIETNLELNSVAKVKPETEETKSTPNQCKSYYSKR